MKVAHDHRRVIPAAIQITPQVSHQLRLGVRPFSPNGIGLNVLVKHLVWVQIRTVGWQEKHLHPRTMSIQPVADRLAPMHRVSIDDQKNLSLGMLDQSTQKPNKHLRRKMSLEHHERQIASIGNRRKDICPETVPCPRSYRSLPPRGIRPSRLMIRTGPHRVPPIQLCLLYFRTRPDDWVLLIEPSGDSHRIPFVGPPNRLLRGKPPTLKIAPDRPSRKLDTKPPGNQPLNGLRRPQHEGQLQLFRVMVTDQIADGSRLPTFEFPAPSLGATLPSGQTRIAGRRISRKPLPDGLMRDPEDFNRFPLSHAAINCNNDAATELFLNNRLELKSITLHAHKDTLFSYE